MIFPARGTYGQFSAVQWLQGATVGIVCWHLSATGSGAAQTGGPEVAPASHAGGRALRPLPVPPRVGSENFIAGRNSNNLQNGRKPTVGGERD